jgi:hypothetical protein
MLLQKNKNTGWLLLLCFACLLISKRSFAGFDNDSLSFFEADNPNIQYVGRIDFSNVKLPRFWSPGVYINASFEGTSCRIVLNDEVQYGVMHNYIEVVVDGKAARIRLNEKENTIEATKGLSSGKHTITICKNTESGIGYLEFKGIYCNKLLPPQALPVHKIECIGNSITCGTGSDQSEIKCKQGRWEDQHNAYMSYGATTARLLNAQYHLTAVSGIGLTHSCCDLTITMPQVFDKVNMRNDSIRWSFDKYIPDVVTICLGQNDGIQDSATWCAKYIEFIQTIRTHYPNASLFLITSPMADSTLAASQRNYLSGIEDYMHHHNDRRIYTYFFDKQYHNGCDNHPDLNEHQEIAKLLSAYIKKIMKW